MTVSDSSLKKKTRSGVLSTAEDIVQALVCFCIEAPL